MKKFTFLLAICMAVPVFSQSKLSDSQIKEMAQKKFNQYLPNILNPKTGDDAVVLDNSKVYVGDITGDGKKDAVVYYSLALKNGGNAHVGQGMAFYKNLGNSLKVFAGLEPDQLFSVEKISKGKVQVKTYEYAEGDGYCCPSIIKNKVVKFQGNKAYLQ